MSKLLSGRYELIQRIGDGGMAVVYKAKDHLLGRYVAVKILRPEFIRDVQFVESFRKESQAAAGLQHPNIISVYDVGREGDIHFIVMELVEGKSLSEIIEQQAPMDWRQVVQISKQVAQALSVAHDHHIIHRDIKPHNIMITPDGTAKLGDFGIAKAVSDSTLTESDRVMGSVHYFSPEQARGAYVDERSDIYSLGIIMFEMLTGRVPFDGDNPVQVALMHINRDVPAPSTLVSGVPPALDKIVLKATDRFQSNRYKSAKELLSDMSSIEYVSSVMGADAIGAEAPRREDSRKRQQTSQRNQRNQQARQEQAQQERQRRQPDYYDDYEDDYEEERPRHKKRKKKNNRAKVIAGVIAAAVLVGLVAIAYPKMFGRVVVPDVTGKTYARAEKVLEEAGFEAEKGDRVANEKYKKGQVCAQDPSGGTKAKKGSTVVLTISKGASSEHDDKTVSVPNLVGDYYDSSTEAAVKAAGFSLGTVEYRESTTYEKNQIISQTPSAGTEAAKGSDIDIVVCSEKVEDEVSVPTLTGLTIDQAKTKLRSVGLDVGKVSYEESDIYGSGYIMWQEYDAGTKLKKGKSVAVHVSKGSSEEDGEDSDEDESDDGNTSDGGSEANGSSDEDGEE